jgi:hypothetical protein
MIPREPAQRNQYCNAASKTSWREIHATGHEELEQEQPLFDFEDGLVAPESTAVV